MGDPSTALRVNGGALWQLYEIFVPFIGHGD